MTCGNFLRLAILLAGVSAVQAQTETIIHSFPSPGPKGSNPQGLTRGPSGNLYGVAEAVYELSAKGETVFYRFPGGTLVNAGLVADRAGNLYGTTYWVGGSSFGMVFKVTPGRQGTVLYTFN